MSDIFHQLTSELKTAVVVSLLYRRHSQDQHKFGFHQATLPLITGIGVALYATLLVAREESPFWPRVL